MKRQSLSLLFAGALLAIAGCASSSDNWWSGDRAEPDPKNDALIGEEAYLSANYHMADFFLTRSVKNAYRAFVPMQQELEWKHVLANTYWEAGWDDKLMKFAIAELPKIDAQGWKCRVDEREGRPVTASECYLSLDDQRRSDRALRTQVMTSVMSTEDVRFALPQPVPGGPGAQP
jgi:hypothetical protein